MIIFFSEKCSFYFRLERVSVLSKKYRSTSTGVPQYLLESTTVLLSRVLMVNKLL